MPTQKIEISVPITSGIDNFTDPKQSKKMATTHNLYVNRDGELQIRQALSAVSSSINTVGGDRNAAAELAVGKGLVPWNGQPLLVGGDQNEVQASPQILDAISGQGIFGLIDGDGDASWKALGEHAHFHQTFSSGPTVYPDSGALRSAYSRIDDVELFLWAQDEISKDTTTTGFYYALRNITTGVWVVDPTRIAALVGNARSLWALAPHNDGSTTVRSFLIGYLTAAGSLKVRSVNPSTGALGAADTLAAASGLVTDACLMVQSTGAQWATIVAGHADEGDPVLSLYAYTGDKVLKASCDTTLTMQAADIVTLSPTTYYDAARPNFWLVRYDNSVPEMEQHLFPIAFDGGSPRAPIVSGNWAGGVGSSLYDLGAASGHYTECDSVDGGAGVYQWMIAWTHPNSDSNADNMLSVSVAFGRTDMLTGATRRATVELPHCALESRPFVWNKRFWLPLRTGLTAEAYATSGLVSNNLILQELRFVGAYDTLNMPQALVVGSGLPPIDKDGPGAFSRYLLQHAHIASTSVYMPLHRLKRIIGIRGNGTNSSSTLATMVQPCGVHLDSAVAPPQYVRSGLDTIIAGPLMRQIDGACTEVGFLQRPEFNDIVASNGAGSLDADGTYNCSYVFEWVDLYGQVHQSAPAEAVETILAGAEDTLTLELAGVGHSAIPADADVAAADGLTNKRFDTRLVVYRTEAGGAAFFRSDDQLRGQLTRDAQAAETAVEGAADASLAANARLYTDSGELMNDPPPGGKIILSHKNRVFVVPDSDPNTIWPSKERVSGVGLSFNASTVLSLPGDAQITGLAALDDSVIVFKEREIYAFGGAGPNALGVGGFSLPQRINAGVGCRDPNSIVSFDHGVLFKSAAGWYILDRSFGVQEVGLAVRDYDAFEVYRATLIPTRHHIYILHKAADSTMVLIFDYLRGIWTTRSYASGAVGTLVDVANVNDVPVFISSAGGVWTEDNNSYADAAVGGGTFTGQLVTNWINQPDLVNAEQISWVKIAGEWVANSSVTVKFYYDYAAAAAETVTIDTDDIDADGVLRIKPARGQCKAFKLEISGTIWRLSAVTLEVRARPGRIGRVSDLTSS